MSNTDQRWFHRQGELARDGWESVVDATADGLTHAGIRVAQLSRTDSIALPELGVERIVVPLAGSFAVAHFERAKTTTSRLSGRRSVFEGPTDVLYLSAASSAVITGEGRVAVATSPTAIIRPSRHVIATETLVERRGAGAFCSQTHILAAHQTLDTARLVVCEMITPAESWSSCPSRKQAEHVPGYESRLEEIFYFEVAPTRTGGVSKAAESAFGMFSARSSPTGEIEISAMVRRGDIALVPFGFHGTVAAAPGYDLYSLNIMSGTDAKRVWLMNDDPAHGWLRETWTGQDVDTRRPYADDKEGDPQPRRNT